MSKIRKIPNLITTALALSASLAVSGTSSAVSIFIGDAASEGLNVAGSGAAFTLPELTIVNLAGSADLGEEVRYQKRHL